MCFEKVLGLALFKIESHRRVFRLRDFHSFSLFICLPGMYVFLRMFFFFFFFLSFSLSSFISFFLFFLRVFIFSFCPFVCLLIYLFGWVCCCCCYLSVCSVIYVSIYLLAYSFFCFVN